MYVSRTAQSHHECWNHVLCVQLYLFVGATLSDPHTMKCLCAWYESPWTLAIIACCIKQSELPCEYCARCADKPGYPQILLKAISAKSYVWPTSYKYLHSATNEKWALTKNLHNYIHPFCRYGFDYGSVHFVLMSTEHNFTQGSPQYKFLDQHMQGVDRSKTPWLIFAGHRLGGTLPQGVITLRIAC